MAAEKKRGRGRPKNPDSKRSQGLPRHNQPRRAFHGPQELFDALQRYCDTAKPQPSESAVLRLALEEFLARAGHWPPAGGAPAE